MAKTEHHTLQNIPKVVPHPHCSTAKPHLPAEIKRPGKDEYRQGATFLGLAGIHPCLADFSEKGQRMDVVLKPKKLTRQGKAKTRPGKVGLRRLHDSIYPCLVKIKNHIYLPLFILTRPIFFWSVNGALNAGFCCVRTTEY